MFLILTSCNFAAKTAKKKKLTVRHDVLWQAFQTKTKQRTQCFGKVKQQLFFFWKVGYNTFSKHTASSLCWIRQHKVKKSTFFFSNLCFFAILWLLPTCFFVF